MEWPVEQFNSMIIAFFLELRQLVNMTPSDEWIEFIELNGSMTGRHCIAKDGLHPNGKGVGTITQLYRRVSDQQPAMERINELQDSGLEEDKE